MSAVLLMKLLFSRHRKSGKKIREKQTAKSKLNKTPKRARSYNSSVLKDFESLCRICMQASENMILIFGLNSKIGADIQQCANVNITEDDDLPQSICAACRDLLFTATLFRETCETSDREMRKFLEETKEEEEGPLNVPEMEHDDDNDSIEIAKHSPLQTYDNHDALVPLPSNDDDSDYNEFTVTEKDDITDGPLWNATRTAGDDDKNVLVRSYTKRAPRTNCAKCNEKFESEFDYKIHRLTEEHKKKPWQCRECNKICDSKTSYDNHLRVHTLERPYICDVCGKAFTQVASLTTHMMIHANAFPYSCSQCPHRCRTKHTLKQHERVHSGEKPFKCPHCTKTFSNRSNQRAHSVKHFNPRPFECELCGKAYAFRQAYKDHKYTVHENKRYECTICGATMAHMKNLREHERRIHKRKKRAPGIMPAYLRNAE